MRIALIDSDSISYILGWVYKDIAEDDTSLSYNEVETVMHSAVDSFMVNILNTVKAEAYITASGTGRSFRHHTYKFKEYKGTRKEKEDWIKFWQPIITQRLIEKWYAVSVNQLEADDLVSIAAERLGEEHDVIICSPDKDLKQIPGEHYDYKKNEMCTVTADQASYNFWLQMLIGDDVDCIAGLPGTGIVKAKAMLKECHDDVSRAIMVKGKYDTYFGSAHYGPMIFRETRCAVELMCRSHPMYVEYDVSELYSIKLRYHKYEKETEVDQSLLTKLGWA